MYFFPQIAVKAGLEKFWNVVAMPAFLRVMMMVLGGEGLFNLFSFRHYTSHFHFIFLKYINTLYF